MSEQLDLSIIAGFRRGLMPEPIISITEWANTNRVISGGPRPGPYDASVTPYLLEIMECLSTTSPVQKVIFKKGSQIGATEAAINMIGYIVCTSPDPIIYVMPSQDKMAETSSRRIQPMIDNCPALLQRFAGKRSRDSRNTILQKDFENGFLLMLGANSPTGLSSTTARFAILDEGSRFPTDVGGEGSVIGLAETRLITYGDRSKVFMLSTPTLKDLCIISKEYEKTGQREYYVPCPHCKHLQVLDFYRLRYTPPMCEDARYECEKCSKLIEERYKTWMMNPENGAKYIARFPEKETGLVVGFWVNAMYSPYGMYSWAKMCREDLAATTIEDQKIFINTKLGLEYEEKGDKPDWEALKRRATDYKKGQPFNDVVMLTAGADIQADRIEVEVVGWMPGMSSQQIWYDVLKGDTKKPEVYKLLEDVLNMRFKRPDGVVLGITQTCIDANYNTATVYEFTQRIGFKRAVPIQGRDTLQSYYGPPKAVSNTKAGKKDKHFSLWPVGSSFLKEEVYSMLAQAPNEETGEMPLRYCYLPAWQSDDYFKGLTAEEQQTSRNKKGQVVRAWVKKFKRNEALDIRCYALAAAAILGLHKKKPEWWAAQQASYEPEKEIVVLPTPPKPKTPKKSIWK